jgi:hypothetical protein
MTPDQECNIVKDIIKMTLEELQATSGCVRKLRKLRKSRKLRRR